MSTKMQQSAGFTSLLATPLITKVEIHENTLTTVLGGNANESLHWMRTWLFGECPSCHGTHNKQILGWNKRQCENCGNTWTYC